MMETKKYAYAAIGAPVAIARQVQEKVGDLRAKATERALSISRDARHQVDAWSREGEKLVGKVTESKKIDDLTAKVDLGPAKEQVNKLRDQVEDLLSTWKANFRPETVAQKQAVPEKQPADRPASKTGAKRPATGAATTKPAAAKKPAAKKPAAKKPAAKTAAPKTAPKTEVKAS